MNTQIKMTSHSVYPGHNTGVALFEILIALLVLSVGLLGLATLQSQGLRSSSSATLRTEATFLAMDITDRMRSSMSLPAPPPAPPAPPILPAGYILATTGTIVNAGADMVSQDLNAWTADIQARLGGGQANTWGASILNAPAAVGAPPGTLIVTIMWDDARRGIAGRGCSGNPAVDMTCFQTLFRP